MLLFLALFILAVWSCRFRWHGTYDDYLSKEQTTAINGIFIVWVFIRHVQSPYLVEAGYTYSLLGDSLFRWIDLAAGQLIVAMFLFNSGYGVMAATLKGGMDYVKRMPVRRILTTYLNFAIAVGVFVAFRFIVDSHPVGLSKVLLSFMALDGVGNSYWYIFAILVCYAVFWLSALCVRLNPIRMLPLLCAGVGAYVWVMSLCMPLYWYSTASAFAMGCVYCVFKNRIDDVVQRVYWPCFVVVWIAFYFVHFRLGFEWHGVRSNVVTLLFVIGFVLLMMKFRMRNAALLWLGSHLFPIYIYQRLPMFLLDRCSSGWLTKECVSLFIIISWCLALMIAWAYRWWRVDFSKVRR